MDEKNAKLASAILTTIHSPESPQPFDIQNLNEHARKLLSNKSVSVSNFSDQKLNSSKLLYISRKSQSRYSKIDAAIEEILIELGFFVLLPEEFTLQQQMYFFDNSKLVIGNHGAALANLVFCRKGTQVIELAVIEIQINDWMKNLAQNLELDYDYLEINHESDLLKLRNLVLSAIRRSDAAVRNP